MNCCLVECIAHWRNIHFIFVFGRTVVLIACALIVSCNLLLTGANNNTCYPGMSCFPEVQELASFTLSMGGRALFPYQKEYDSLVPMRNVHKTKFPYIIVIATSAEDVRKSVLFAQKHNMKITIKVNIVLFLWKLGIAFFQINDFVRKLCFVSATLCLLELKPPKCEHAKNK